MSELHVYKASAGSGKTFLLTQAYIRLIIQQPERYRNILAVTFTNKATAEMKLRILSELDKIAKAEPSEYSTGILKDLQISPTHLQEKAQLALTQILHDYSHFHVSTIDRFFQSILKAFTKEIGMQSAYNIELDTDLVLTKAKEQLLAKLGENKQMLSWLMEFTDEKIREGKKWNNIDKAILTLSKEILKENYKTFDHSLVKKFGDKTFIKTFSRLLFQVIRSYEEKVQKRAHEFVVYYKSAGLTVEDFIRKNAGLGAFAEKNRTGVIKEPNSYVVAAIDNMESWLPKNAPANTKKTVAAHFPELNRKLKLLYECFDEEYRRYLTALQIKKNIYMLGILTDISRELNRISEENNFILLQNSNQLLHDLVKGNDAPFVYEKAGNYYKHFLIDEFQDTSLMQWESFLPLIKNCLSEENYAMLVGDVKQAIYRWRNSNWKIMAEKIFTDMQPWNIRLDALKENWRSEKQIIEFNNAFYKEAVKTIQDQINKEKPPDSDKISGLLKNIEKAYDDHEQKAGKSDDNGGYIKIQFLPHEKKNDFQQNALEQLTKTIAELQKQGIKAKDIAVLVRSNKECGIIAGHLLEQKKKAADGVIYDIISSESLYLKNALSVRIIIHAVQYIQKREKVDLIALKELYQRYILENPSFSNYNTCPENPFENLPEAFAGQMETFKKQSLYETVETLIRIFELNTIKSEFAYLQTFQDHLFQFAEKNVPSINSFLEYWEEKKEKLCIQSPENQNAITIVTIHKAKGLEFEAVILPFCDWAFEIRPSAGQNILWAKTDGTVFQPLETVPVEYSRQLEKTLFAEEYYREKMDILIDNLNLLYVATTRPKKALCIFSKEYNPPASGKEKVNNIATLLYKTIMNSQKTLIKGHWNEEQNTWESGKIRPCKTIPELENTLEMTAYPSRPLSEKMTLRFHVDDFYKQDEISDITPIQKGLILHRIMQLIDSHDDIELALQKVWMEGNIGRDEISAYKTQIEAILSKPEILPLYDGSWKVLNERNLLTGDGKKYRPDRMMIKTSPKKSGQEVVVLDYKFGDKKSTAHSKQLEKYMTMLNEMHYKKIEGYILYGIQGELVKVEASSGI